MKILICVFVLLPTHSWAAVKDHSERFALAIISETPQYSLTIAPNQKNNNSDKVKYVPNVFATSGFQFTAFGFSVAYLQDVIPEEASEQRFGNTSYEDIRLGFFFGKNDKYQIYTYYNRFKGLYVENSNAVDGSIAEGDPRLQNADLSIFNSGVSFLWTLNPDQYSPSAAFSHSTQQTGSGGSWLVRTSIDSSLFSDEEEIIPSQVRSDYGDDQNVTEARFVSLGLQGGYGYAWVWNNFYLAAQALLGGGHQRVSYSTTDLGNQKLDRNLSKFSLGLSSGYNGEDFYATISLISDNTSYKTDSIKFTAEQSVARVTIGYRF